MKVISIFAVICVFAAYMVAAMPAEEANAAEKHLEKDNIYDDLITFAANQPKRSGRHARATCDLLSVSTPWVTLNHAACAAHCLAMNRGFRGGRCRDGICHCRR